MPASSPPAPGRTSISRSRPSFGSGSRSSPGSRSRMSRSIASASTRSAAASSRISASAPGSDSSERESVTRRRAEVRASPASASGAVRDNSRPMRARAVWSASTSGSVSCASSSARALSAAASRALSCATSAISAPSATAARARLVARNRSALRRPPPRSPLSAQRSQCRAYRHQACVW